MIQSIENLDQVIVFDFEHLIAQFTMPVAVLGIELIEIDLRLRMMMRGVAGPPPRQVYRLSNGEVAFTEIRFIEDRPNEAQSCILHQTFAPVFNPYLRRGKDSWRQRASVEHPRYRQLHITISSYSDPRVGGEINAPGRVIENTTSIHLHLLTVRLDRPFAFEADDTGLEASAGFLPCFTGSENCDPKFHPGIVFGFANHSDRRVPVGESAAIRCDV